MSNQFTEILTRRAIRMALMSVGTLLCLAAPASAQDGENPLAYAIGAENTDDNGAQHPNPGQEISIEHGLTEFWRTAVEISAEQDALEIGNDFEVLEPGAVPVDIDVFAGYESLITETPTHTAEIRPTIRLPIGPFETIVSPSAKKQFGAFAESGIALGYTWESRATLTKHLSVGVEALGTLENVTNGVHAPIEHDLRLRPTANLDVDLGRFGALGLETGLRLAPSQPSAPSATEFNLQWQIPFGVNTD